MNEIGNPNNSALNALTETPVASNPAVDALSIQTRTADEVTPQNELGQDTFLQLMITQLENQDPLSPQENGEFIAQLAQFSSVEGIQKLNDTMAEMAGSFRSNQALQASALVGRSVRVPGDSAELAANGSISGAAELPVASGQIQMLVTNSGGELVVERSLGSQDAPGDIEFEWDGTDAQGEQSAPGNYSISVNALIDGESQTLAVAVDTNVNSVTLGDRVSLNLSDGREMALSEVKEVF